jgi:hypothetical protein
VDKINKKAVFVDNLSSCNLTVLVCSQQNNRLRSCHAGIDVANHALASIDCSGFMVYFSDLP